MEKDEKIRSVRATSEKRPGLIHPASLAPTKRSLMFIVVGKITVALGTRPLLLRVAMEWNMSLRGRSPNEATSKGEGQEIVSSFHS